MTIAAAVVQSRPVAVAVKGGSIVGPKGDPGSPGEGYATRTAMAARAAPALLDDVYLTEHGREGKFVVDLASNWTAAIAADTAQGLFIPSTADATKVYVRKYDGPIHGRWFGIKADGATNDGPAVLAALATCLALGNGNLTGYGTATPELKLPFTGNFVKMGTNTLSLTQAIALTGYGSGQYGGQATILKWDLGCDGIEIRAPNCRLEGIGLQGSWSNGTAEGEFHGLKVYQAFTYRDLWIANWQGDGVHANISLGSGGDTEGNANCVWGERSAIDSCRNGVSLAGSDVNASNFLGFNINNCRQAAIFDNAFLGNTHIGTQIATTGIIAATGTPFGACFQSGHIYYAVLGQEAGASTNAPSGTTANNTWWRYWKDSGAATAYAPQWVSGMSVRAQGPLLSSRVNDQGVYINPFLESGDPPAQLGTADLVIGGSGAFDKLIRRISANTNGLQLDSDFVILNGNVTAQFPFNGSFVIDASTGGQVWDPTLTLKTGNAFCEIDYSNASGVFAKQFCSTSSQQWVFNNLQSGGSFHFQVQNADVATLDATGLGLPTGKTLKANGAITTTAGGIGYATGAGGAVIQATSKSTTVTLNGLCGEITMTADPLAAGAAAIFTLLNSQIGAHDCMVVNLGGGAANFATYVASAAITAAGSAKITLRNMSAASLSEAVVIRFAVIKAVNA